MGYRVFMIHAIAPLLVIPLFLGAVTGLLFFLAWLERPHRWLGGARYVPSRRSSRPPL